MLRIGMIGLDTSHAIAFTELLNDPLHPHHVPGGKITVAFKGGSPDFELSASRVDGYARHLQEHYRVELLETPAAVAEQCDCLLLESVDGRTHSRLFSEIAPFGKPVFVDKPFALSREDAEEMLAQARHYGVPIMSSSAMRFAPEWTRAISNMEPAGAKGEIRGVDCYGPMALEPTQPGLFWYGIHPADMLFAAMGPGCIQVNAVTNEEYELVVGKWMDGRIGTLRGNRTGNRSFGGTIHRVNETSHTAIVSSDKAIYANLLKRAVHLFQTGESAVEPTETLEIIRFLEAANESRAAGKPVDLV